MRQLTGVIGRKKAELDTPSLLVDLDVMEGNIRRIAGTCRRHGIAWRPHMKGQKVPLIVHKELAAGAIGVTCAKISEAEVMAGAGIGDILIANQIVGAQKIARLAALRRHVDVMVAIDDASNAAELAAAARARGVTLRVVIEHEIGIRRSGVQPGEAAVALAREVAGLEGLDLAGVMGWEGQTAEINPVEAKEQAIRDSVGALVASAEACRAAGIGIGIVSCGGTATYWVTAGLPGVTEIQAGGGVFADVRYTQKCGLDHPCALTLLTTVVSRPSPTRIVCDAGKKAMSSDAAVPLPLGLEGIEAVRLSAEHTTIDLERPSATPRIGDRQEFVVGYSDTTVHLHELMIGLRDGAVETIWPVLARGRLD
jgi:D-serine deaminase-like pyridoxal phosphate-dependent protein